MLNPYVTFCVTLGIPPEPFGTRSLLLLTSKLLAVVFQDFSARLFPTVA